MNSYSIIPECWADRLLVQTLGYEPENHQHSIGQVNNVMKNKFENKFAIGIIDNDKRKPSDFEKFKKIDEKSHLMLKKGSGKRQRHYLIMISPAIESWLESVGNSVKVPKPYKDDRIYRKQMKSMEVGKNKQITAYFNTINQKNPAAFKTIKTWISSILAGKL